MKLEDKQNSCETVNGTFYSVLQKNEWQAINQHGLKDTLQWLENLFLEYFQTIYKSIF